MHLARPRFRPLPLFYRVLGIILVVGFLLIGVVGLILPVIPGLVFLLLAVYVLTRSVVNGIEWCVGAIQGRDKAS